MGTEIEILQKKFSKARSNILMMIVLSCVNIILIVFNSTINFPFSVSVPQFILAFGQGVQVELNSLTPLIIAVIISLLCMGVYFLFYLLSKKRPIFLIFILALFSIDTLIFLALSISFFEISLLIDIAFHAWVIYYIINGIISNSKLKKLNLYMINNPEIVTEQQPAPTHSDEKEVVDTYRPY